MSKVIVVLLVEHNPVHDDTSFKISDFSCNVSTGNQPSASFVASTETIVSDGNDLLQMLQYDRSVTTTIAACL